MSAGESSSAGRSGAKHAARAATEAALLDAATALLFESPGIDVLRSIKPVDVARRADPPRTTGAFYNIWPTQNDFRRDLLHHLLTMERFGADLNTLAALADSLAAPEFDLAETIRLAATVNFEGNKDDPAFRVQLGLWTRHGSDPEVTRSLHDLYAEMAGSAIPMYQLVLERSGRRMRPPHTLETFAVAVTALGEGLSVRWSVDPEAVPDHVGPPHGVEGHHDRPWSTYALTTYLLAMAVTEPDD